MDVVGVRVTVWTHAAPATAVARHARRRIPVPVPVPVPIPIPIPRGRKPAAPAPATPAAIPRRVALAAAQARKDTSAGSVGGIVAGFAWR